MAQARDWQGMKDMSVRLLKERTGEGVDEWNRRIKRERFDDEDELRAWLTKQGVTGYAQSLLVMERFGYPDFLVATADELIDGQYSDRPQLRPIFDALIDAAVGLWQGHDSGTQDVRLARLAAEDLRPDPANREKPDRSRAPARRAEARPTSAAFEDSRNHARPN